MVALNKFQPGCCCNTSPCAFCNGGTGPQQVQVTFGTGILNDTCADCTAQNSQTYILDFQTPDFGVTCFWRFEIGGTCDLFVDVYFDMGTTLNVALFTRAFTNLNWRIVGYGSDCNFNNVSVPWHSTSADGCKGAPTNVTVTAL